MRQIAFSLSLAGLAFIMTAIWGGPLLRILRHYKVGKIIRVIIVRRPLSFSIVINDQIARQPH